MRLIIFDQKKERAHAKRRCKDLFITIIISQVLCFIIFPNIALAMQTANTEATLGITSSIEHDDNIELTNDSDKEDDLILHTIPTFKLTHFLNEHNLNLLLEGDYREGVDTVDGEINLEASVGVDFNFAGGLMIGFSDTFKNEEFDQHLYTEVGVSDSQKNIYALNTAYSFGERTSVKALYSHEWEEYDDEPEHTVYNTDTFNARVTIPVSMQWKSYLDAELDSLESAEAVIRNNDAIQGVLGFLWEGPNRFSFWFESGVGEIDYKEDEIEDFSEAIGETGVEIDLSEWSFVQVSVGRNSYGKLKYKGIFRHNFKEKLELTLRASRDRLRSYTLKSVEDTYDVSIFQLTLNSTFLERIKTGLTASYQIQDQENSVETLIGKATLDYPIQDWIQIGAHYQYATRAADNPEEEYDDNRLGCFVTLSL